MSCYLSQEKIFAIRERKQIIFSLWNRLILSHWQIFWVLSKLALIFVFSGNKTVFRMYSFHLIIFKLSVHINTVNVLLYCTVLKEYSEKPNQSLQKTFEWQTRCRIFFPLSRMVEFPCFTLNRWNIHEPHSLNFFKLFYINPKFLLCLEFLRTKPLWRFHAFGTVQFNLSQKQTVTSKIM